MERSMHRIRPRTILIPLAAVATLMVAAALLVNGGAGAATNAAAATNQRSVRQITKNASTAFPTGQSVTPRNGIQDPEIAPGDIGEGGGAGAAATARKAASRSMSHRPSATSAAMAANPMVPTVKPTALTASNPGQAKSFEGLNLFQQRFANGGNQFSVEPPDQGLCAGGGFAIETVNDVLRVFRTSGAAASPVTDLNTFFGYPAQIDRTTGVVGPFVTDPSCLWDAATKRFFVAVLTLEVDPASGAFLGPNHLDVAVSQTASPLGAWNIYRLPVQDDGTQGTPSHTDCPCIGDYPHLGADSHGFYLTTNEYPFGSGPGVFGNNFNGAQVYAFSKAALASGAATVNVVQFENTVLSDGVTPGFTVWPAQSNPGQFATGNGGTEYFLSSTAAQETLNAAGLSNRIGVWRLTNSASLDTASPAPVLASAIVTSEDYGVPPRSEQKAGNVPLRDCINTSCLAGIGPSPVTEVEGPLDSNDSRMQQTWFAGGKLYGALDTVARVTGKIKAATAFFVVDPATAAIASQGYVAVTGNNVNYPAVAVLPNGHGVMAFTLTGGNHFPSASYVKLAGGAVTGGVHVASAGAGPQDGFCEYVFFNCAGTAVPAARPRWGDYGAAVTLGANIWIASESIEQTCTFTTWQADTTCGGTRAALGNWSTRVSQVKP